LGGLLTEQVGWRSIFYVNLPVAVASLAWGWRLGGDRRSGPFRLDLAGVGLLAGGLGLTLVGVTLAPVWGWTMPSSLALMSAGFGGIVAFVALESRRADPLLDVSLFRRSRVFAAANFAALANYTAFFAVTVLTAVFLQVAGGRSPQEAGYLLVSQPVVMAALSSSAGRASDRVGSRWLASGGMGVIAVGLLLLSRLPVNPSVTALTVSLVVVGFGMAAFSSPNTSAVMGAAPRDQLGVASGTIGTMRFLGQALSVAILGSLATSRLGAAGQAVLFSGHAESPHAALSFVDGYRLAMLVGAGIAAAGALASLARQ
ncbi:MAG: MFS transporter, partial [Acidimicrobiales bacterium]|nr:MFS transporter [Acidimicrobiales bacterium]